MKWPLLAAVVVIAVLISVAANEWGAQAQEGTLPEPTVAPEPTPDLAAMIGQVQADLIQLRTTGDVHATAQADAIATVVQKATENRSRLEVILSRQADLAEQSDNWGLVAQQDFNSVKNALFELAQVPTPEPGVTDRLDQWQEAFDQWVANETATALTPVPGGVHICNYCGAP